MLPRVHLEVATLGGVKRLMGPALDEKAAAADLRIAGWMEADGHYVDVDTSLSLRKPELHELVARARQHEPNPYKASPRQGQK